ncbi:hypothetical protein ACWDCB_03160 [Streptomyces sp. NPDC001178]
MTAQNTVWPEGVIARYLTVGGATVDLAYRLTVHKPPEPFATWADCTGCPASSEHSHYRLVRGLYADREEHDQAAADEEARAWAQAHAERCRALPSPGVAA